MGQRKTGDKEILLNKKEENVKINTS